MRPRLHHLFVIVGLIGGIAAGTLLIDTEPGILGVLIGAGAGLSGGAFFAAITSGEQLASGGGNSGYRDRRRRINPALRHWESSAPPSMNGKHEEHSASESGDPSRDRLN